MPGFFFLKLNWFFALGLACTFLLRNAPAPENTGPFFYAIIAFIVFILFVSAIFSIGAAVRTRVKLPFFSDSEDAFFDLSVGVTVVYILAYALTALNLFSSSTFYLLWFLLALGFELGSAHVKPSRWFYFGTNWFERLLTGVPLALVVLKLVEGFQYPRHGDAYVTYLPAPRSWAVHGGFQDYTKFTEFFLSTTWESLYAWGTALMGFHDGAGLDLSQWFAQWTTGGIAVLGLIFGFYAIGRRLYSLFPVPLHWHSVAAIAAIQVPCLQWTANLAKNDLGAAFLGISGFYFSYYLGNYSVALAVLSGLLTGAAVYAKLPLVTLGICIFLFLLVRRSPLKIIVGFCSGGLLGMAPILIRNYSLTKNPVYPFLPSIFPAPHQGISAAEGGARATSAHFALSDLPTYLNEFFSQSPLILVALVFLIWPRTSKTSWKFLAVPLAALAFFTVTLRPSTEIRYESAALFIFIFFSAYAAFYLAGQFTRFKKWLPLIPAVYILATSNISFFTFTQLTGPKFGPWSKVFPGISETGGAAKLWIRQHLKPTDTILVVGDGYPFYLLDYAITPYGNFRALETLVAEKKIPEAAETFKTMPFQYLYLANDADYLAYRPTLTQVMEYAKRWNQNCLQYQTGQAQVWDLSCLKEQKI